MIGEAETQAAVSRSSKDSGTASCRFPGIVFVPETKGYTCDWTRIGPECRQFRNVIRPVASMIQWSP